MSELVSIIMPSYNTAKFISDTINSVLNQTYTNWELIIVDDCSKDNTDDVVKEFLNDERIKYIKNEKNSGAAVSRNRAILEAKGKWIAFLDSDDLWTEDKLEKQIKFMEDNNYHFSYTNYEEIKEDSTPLNISVTGPKKITRAGMFNYCWPGCLTIMYDADHVGLIQIADLKKNNDYAMWLKVIKKANCYLLNENLGKYRIRSGSISRHSKGKLIKHHYLLYKIGEEKNAFVSSILTVRNLFFGVYKKIRYVKKICGEIMKKIGISAPFDFKGMYHGGQCVKAREVYGAFCEKYGKENVEILETYHDKNYIKLLFKSFLMMKNCERIAMLPAHNGLKIFAPLYAFLNKFFKRKLYYFVVGGWLPEYIEENKFLKNPLKKFNAIFVETNIMKEKLEKQGFENVFYFPNFRQMKILKQDELVYLTSAPFKLCTFSRIIKQKGIEDAIKSVIETNEKIGKDVFNLDIYGIVDDDYKEEFDSIMENAPSYIEYKGCVKPESAIDVLKEYFALLFPTYYQGEGLAGTLVDAFAAGVPVIATNWRYNAEIVENGVTGLVYDYRNKDLLTDTLEYVYSCPDKFNLLKVNCINEAEKYTKETALKIIENYL